MKNINYIVGGLAAAISTASYGFGYDSTTDAPGGDRPTERHVIQFITELSDCASEIICQQTASPGSEFIAMIEVNNATQCAGGMACAPTNAQDTYQGTGGNASLNDEPLVPIAEIYLPNNPLAPTNDLREVTLVTSLSEWDFTTDGTGRLEAGYIISDSSFGAGTVGVFLIEQQIVRTYRGTSSDITISCAIDPDADYETCWSGGPINNDAGPATEQHFDYVTLPEDSTLAKAVPVPAFAAAALGLGLIGITLLTGRRRQVK